MDTTLKGFILATIINWILFIILLTQIGEFRKNPIYNKLEYCFVVRKSTYPFKKNKCPAPVKPREPAPVIPQPREEIILVPKSTPGVTTRVQKQVKKKTIIPPTPSPKVDNNPMLLKRYISGLQITLQENLYYPPEAIEDRQEGVVLLGFDVVRSGELNNMSVIKGSGYPILNEAAQESLSLLSPYQPVPKSIKGNKWSFTIPIEYNLNNIQ